MKIVDFSLRINYNISVIKNIADQYIGSTSDFDSE